MRLKSDNPKGGSKAYPANKEEADKAAANDEKFYPKNLPAMPHLKEITIEQVGKIRWDQIDSTKYPNLE